LLNWKLSHSFDFLMEYTELLLQGAVQAACCARFLRRWWLGLDQVFKMTEMLASPDSAFPRYRAR